MTVVVAPDERDDYCLALAPLIRIEGIDREATRVPDTEVIYIPSNPPDLTAVCTDYADVLGRQPVLDQTLYLSGNSLGLGRVVVGVSSRLLSLVTAVARRKPTRLQVG